jgi:hypothetical protein
MNEVRGRVDEIVKDPEGCRGTEALLPLVRQMALLSRELSRQLNPAERLYRGRIGGIEQFTRDATVVGGKSNREGKATMHESWSAAPIMTRALWHSSTCWMNEGSPTRKHGTWAWSSSANE